MAHFRTLSTAASTNCDNCTPIERTTVHGVRRRNQRRNRRGLGFHLFFFPPSGRWQLDSTQLRRLRFEFLWPLAPVALELKTIFTTKNCMYSFFFSTRGGHATRCCAAPPPCLPIMLPPISCLTTRCSAAARTVCTHGDARQRLLAANNVHTSTKHCAYQHQTMCAQKCAQLQLNA